MTFWIASNITVAHVTFSNNGDNGKLLLLPDDIAATGTISGQKIFHLPFLD